MALANVRTARTCSKTLFLRWTRKGPLCAREIWPNVDLCTFGTRIPFVAQKLSSCRNSLLRKATQIVQFNGWTGPAWSWRKCRHSSGQMLNGQAWQQFLAQPRKSLLAVIEFRPQLNRSQTCNWILQSISRSQFYLKLDPDFCQCSRTSWLHHETSRTMRMGFVRGSLFIWPIHCAQKWSEIYHFLETCSSVTQQYNANTLASKYSFEV